MADVRIPELMWCSFFLQRALGHGGRKEMLHVVGRTRRTRTRCRTDGRPARFPYGSASFLSRRSQWRTECTYATDSPRPVPGLYELGAALPFEKLLGCAKYCAEGVTISRSRLRGRLHTEIFKDGKIERCLAPERTYISISTCLRRIKRKQETKSAPR